jgi:hypothetical protein
MYLSRDNGRTLELSNLLKNNKRCGLNHGTPIAKDISLLKTSLPAGVMIGFEILSITGGELEEVVETN